MMEVLCETDFVTLARLDENTLLYTRGEKPYASTTEIAEDFLRVLAKVAELDTSRMGLLVDLRAVAGRNDPQFETAHSEHRRKLMRAFRRIAIIVASSVGKLQVTRYAASDGGTIKTFDTREAALAWLAE